MTEIRKLGFGPHGTFYQSFAGVRQTVTDPTPAEVADLLARVLEAAGLRQENAVEQDSPEDHLWDLIAALESWRAALARDAANAAEDREVEALADEFDQAFVSDDIRRSVARRAYELGARPNGGAGDE